MKYLILCLTVIVFYGCGFPPIFPYEIDEMKEVTSGIALAKTSLPFEEHGYYLVFPGYICEWDTTIRVASKKPVEGYFLNDSVMVFQLKEGRVRVLTYNPEESRWWFVSNRKAKKDSLIKMSGRELVYPKLTSLENMNETTFEEFLEYPGWRSCD